MEITRTGASETVEVEPGVHLTQLAVGTECSVQHVRIEPGGAVPEHSHPHEQVGFVYEGELTFPFEEGEAITVGPGDSYWLEGEEVHAAENEGETTVRAIDVFSPPRPNPGWLE
jgi:quercetin dioxygenase-like cupin family protein